jgi:hypothetical protein
MVDRSSEEETDVVWSILSAFVADEEDDIVGKLMSAVMVAVP